MKDKPMHDGGHEADYEAAQADAALIAAGPDLLAIAKALPPASHV